MKFFSLLLLISINSDYYSATGVVELSPSPVAPVCQEGDQLELICNTTSGIDHQWEFTVFPENVSHTIVPVSSIGASGIPMPLMIGNSMITFSRLSRQNVLPLISMITISSVTSDLNGTVVNCFEPDTGLVATTTIQIIDHRQLNFELSARPDFLSNGVTVTLEWMLLNFQMYYQQFLYNISVSANPQPNNVMFTGDMRVQLILLYNTPYIVNVTQHSTCRLPNQTTILELNFIKCGDPMELTNALARDYVDPALEGQNITFTCPPYQTLNGSNSSTCMGNGEWEPDPREVECTSTPVTTTTSLVTTTIAICSSPSYVLRISDPARVIKDSRQEFDDTDTMLCCSGFLITSANNTICLENGEWELDTSQMNEGCVSDPVNDDKLIDALIAVSCVLVVVSAAMLIIGFLGGHYLGQKYRKSHDQATSNTAATPNSLSKGVDDLELNKNVAYITLRPR